MMMLIAVLLVRFGFSPDDIGQFEYFLFMANAMTFFWTMGMKNALLSYTPNLSQESKHRLLSSVSVLFVIIAALEAIGILMLARYNPDYGGNNIHFYLALFLVLHTPTQLIEVILIIREEPRILFWETILFYGTLLLLIIYTNGIYTNALAPILAFLFWSVLRMVYFLFLLFNTSLRFDLTAISPFVVFSLPLILQVLLGNGMEFVDGFIVRHYFDDDAFAYYRYGAKELPINTVLISAMSLAIIPIATKNLLTGMDEIKSRLSKVMDWMFPLSAVLIFVSKPLYTTVFSEEYSLSADIFSIYLLIVISRVILVEVIFYAKHYNKILMIVALIEIIINVSLSLIFVRIWGILGIAYATLIAYIVQKLILVVYHKVKLDIDFSAYMDTRRYYSYVAGLIIVFIISQYMW